MQLSYVGTQGPAQREHTKEDPMLTTICAIYVLAVLAAALDLKGNARVNVLFVMTVIAIVAAAVLA